MISLSLALLLLPVFQEQGHPHPSEASSPRVAPIHVPASTSVAASGDSIVLEGGRSVRTGEGSGWLEYAVPIQVSGRYRCDLHVRSLGGQSSTLWIEDYVENPDGRTYDITAPMLLEAKANERVLTRYGSPLAIGEHRMRIHYAGGRVELEALELTLISRHQLTPASLVQGTEGQSWSLVWSDEFDGEGLPDPTRWTADVGNWGWGNREPQYYTVGRTENARQENGCLVIESRRDDMGYPWTSARLTTRGKLSFLYGRFEIRAQVPTMDGTWAAGWLLGDAYRDELSWPYCGEVDVLEGVGREIDDTSGDGLNHASCHTRAYYFKQGNHISSTRKVAGMGSGFHTYAMEWSPTSIEIFVDGVHYYTYDKRADALEWPFDKPHNLVLNLAMGGGMGGAIDPQVTSQKFLVDYVRVYGKQ
ncbi:MAG: beta-glucanase (GH16 family) [Planctomycetota bacterium]|jgi:beta-glucanase (GH16 family)